MENSKKIQIGLLGLIALLLVLNLTGAVNFGSMFGGSSDTSARDNARSSLTTNVTGNNGAAVTPGAAATNPAAPGAAAAAKAAEPPAPTGPTTEVNWDETEFDFGTVDQGEKVTHVYKFKNTGSEPVIISNAKGSCGCTVPKWPKEPIPVGASGEIEVSFDSKGKKGKQNKRVTITANTNPTQSYLTIKGDVNAPEGATPTPAPAAQAPAAAPKK